MARPPLDLRLLRERNNAGRLIIAVAGVSSLAGLVILAQAVLLASIVADVFRDGADLDAVQGDLVLLGVLFLSRAALLWLRRVLAMRAATRVKRGLRRRVVTAVVGHGAADLGGETVVTAIQGVDALDGYFVRYLPELISSAIVPMVGIIWVGLIDGMSGLILLVTVPLIPIFMVLIGDLADRQTERRWRRLTRLGSVFQEMVHGMTTLRVFGRANDWLHKLEESSNRLREETMATLRVAFLSALVLELLATIGTALVAVAVGLRVVYSQLDFQPALAVLIMAPEVYLPLRRVGTEFHAAMEGIKASGSVFEIVDRDGYPDGAVTAPQAATVPIEVRNVTVAFGNHVLLSDFTMKIVPGEFVAVTGESGAGKTTLLRALMGLRQPDSGAVMAGDVDLAEIEKVGWWRQVAYMPQDPFLRAGSIRDNLLLADQSAGDAEIWEALRLCDLEPFVSSLPDGLDTVIGEAGGRLSAGQRRLLAFARILVRNTPVVLVDEPTTNVDPDTRRTIARVLREISGARTVVAVLHDPDSAAYADRCVAVVRK